jgi:hypothetical protein
MGACAIRRRSVVLRRIRAHGDTRARKPLACIVRCSGRIYARRLSILHVDAAAATERCIQLDRLRNELAARSQAPTRVAHDIRLPPLAAGVLAREDAAQAVSPPRRRAYTASPRLR